MRSVISCRSRVVDFHGDFTWVQMSSVICFNVTGFTVSREDFTPPAKVTIDVV